MSRKFGKHREVDYRYLNVPIKYITNYTGKHEDGKNHYRNRTYEEWLDDQHKLAEQFNDVITLEKEDLSREAYEKELKLYKTDELWASIGEHDKVLVKEAKDKTLTIVDIFGKNALVAWRNNKTCKMGMTKLCPMIWKHGKLYLKYKDNLIQLSNTGGWVL
ncbi:MAG: hypothetical protein II670_10875 [Alphaproteobacteria bacterium]|nr:hypothetical protein [Alphaproteobacteria bacterium]